MIVGIDLGTTNSLIACYDHDHWMIIPNEFNELLTPSVVSVYEDGTYVVGKIAKERMITHPDCTFHHFKREMGTDKRYGYRGITFTPESLSSILIRYLVDQAEHYLDEKVDEVLVTVPAHFDDLKRSATKNAAKLAGVKIERIINEPSAAALSYYNMTGREGYLMIFDFGGGTLDISVVDVFRGVIDVQSVSGDNKLGGIDIDNLIAKHFMTQYPYLKHLDQNDFMNLCLAAEETKIKLSTELTSELVFNSHGQEYRYTYDVQLLTDICQSVLLRIRELVTQALKDAQIDTGDLLAIIGIGGSSKILFVRQYLEKLTHVPFLLDIEPQQAVVIGAALAGAIKERNPLVKNMILTDVCPFSLGVGIINNAYSIIIPRNSTLPCSQSSNYQTIYNKQKQLAFKVYQGDNSIASHNQLLTTVKVKVPPLPAGEAVSSVTFTYDINGILQIMVKSSIDESQKMIITNETLDEKMIKIKQSELAELQVRHLAYPEAEYLINYAEKLYYDASLEMKNYISESLNRFKEILGSGKPTRISRAIQSFQAYLNIVKQQEFTVTLYDENVEIEEDDDKAGKVLS